MLLKKTQPRAFDPRFIDLIAAEVFWGYCSRTDYATARGRVLDGDYGKLWTLREAANLLRRYADGISDAELRRCYRQTNQYLMEKARKEENILGALYTEDFAACRPPAFPHDGLVRRLRASVADGGEEDSIRSAAPVAGALLLRTPLPAAVLLKAPPEADILRVGDTRQALGFQKAMLLFVRSYGPLPPNPQGYTHAAHGVFQIPCPEEAAAWFRLIPNAAACRKAVIVPA
jgi:hypothetical protein